MKAAKIQAVVDRMRVMVMAKRMGEEETIGVDLVAKWAKEIEAALKKK